jgi:hypothetical protein
VTGSQPSSLRGAEDTKLRHGYTLRDIEHLAHAAVHRDVWHQSLPLADRLDIAWSAIVEHLYSCEEQPTKASLIRAAWAALRHKVEDEWHTHGVCRTTSVYDGDQVMPNFWRFWWTQAGPTPSPEDRVVEGAALRQIWAALSPPHQAVLAALAALDDYGMAAQSLGRRRQTLVTQVSRARREFLALWHEHEAPSRPWGTDRRRNPDSAHNKTHKNVMAAIARRQKR